MQRNALQAPHEQSQPCARVASRETSYDQITRAPTMLDSAFTLISPPPEPYLGAERNGELGAEED